MIHYIGSKPYFKKLNISETFWNLFSDKSFYIIKNVYSNKKIHIFEKIPDDLKIDENDLMFFSEKSNLNNLNKYPNNIKLWLTERLKYLDKLIPENIDFYCIIVSIGSLEIAEVLSP